MQPAPPSSANDPALRETLSYEKGPGREPMQGTSVPSALARGSMVHRYIILDRVGEGGMGVVYAAYDPSLDRRVALKFLAPHEADRDGIREKRLLREAQAMARLSHPNVVVVYEVGTFQGQVFLAMEFVDGMDLRTWLAETPRSFTQILDIFRAAGRGLAAAHAANIIHRDFKPENVLLDKQDRPRVTDFGLSRASHHREGALEVTAEDRSTALSSPSHLSISLTRTGGVLGTPSYMSPEQRVGGVVDARSDQFSFCVALHEALYGERPFKRDAAAGIDDAVAGRVRRPSAQSSLPKSCRQAILRGLAPAPENRFASMEALLTALSPHPMGRRRQVVFGGLLAVILAGAGMYALGSDRIASPGPRCDLGAQELAGVWDQSRKSGLKDAFQRSGARGAEATWKSFSAIFDQRASSWAAMRNDACAATYLRGAQSPAVLDLRMECLDRKRHEMKALVDLYSDKPDARILDRAVTAVDGLSSVSACADVANLRAVVPLPEDPAARARVQSLRVRLSRSYALYQAGLYEQGVKYTEPLKAEAEALGYPPLAAEAAYALARHLREKGKFDVAGAILLDAVKLAIQGRDSRLEAEIWIELVDSEPSYRPPVPERNRLATRVAEFAIERANGDDLLRARLAHNAAVVEYKARNPNEEIRQEMRAAELYARSLGATSPELARSLAQIGSALYGLGRNPEALEYLERALKLQQTIVRPGHPDIGTSLRAVAGVYLDLGLFRKAVEAGRAALALYVQEFGPESAMTTYALQLIAEAEAGLGNVGRALELFTKMLSIRKTGRGSKDKYLGLTYGTIGRVQRRAGLNNEAEKNLELAIAIYPQGPPWDEQMGYALTNLGFVHMGRGLYKQAHRECRRAEDLLSGMFGRDGLQLIETHECIGEALIAARDFEGARTALERILTPASERNFGAHVTANPRFQLARALWPTPSERPRAVELARTALNELTKAEGDNHGLMARIEAWLSMHRVSPNR